MLFQTDDPWLALLPIALAGIGVFLLVFYAFHLSRALRPGDVPETKSQLEDVSCLGGWGGGVFFLAGAAFLTLPIEYWWISLLVGSAVAFLWFPVRFFLRRRRQSGLCRVCGYDLRATPDRCPECGTVPQIVVRSGKAAAN